MLKSPTRPWKHALTTTPVDTENSLVSLYDLFYDKNGNLWIESTDSQAGCALEHDIICLNSGMLKSDSSIDSSQTATMESSTWWNYGIDVSLPVFDARAKRKEILCDAEIKIPGVKIFDGKKYVIYDKDSALEPRDTTIFSSRGVMSTGLVNVLSWESYLPPSIAEFIPGGDNTSDILLSAPDKAFKSTLVTRDGFHAYNRIIINPYSWFAVCLVAKATGMSLQNLFSTDDLFTPTTTIAFGDYKNFWEEGDKPGTYVATAVNLGANASEESSFGNPNEDGTRWKTLLKNTYVWVRAPFFADYVKPDDFEQSLNPESKVVHNELMLSGAGDFKKYDMFSTSSTEVFKTGILETSSLPGIGANAETNPNDLPLLGMSELSMPYVPKTSPTVDIYTSKLLDKDPYLNGLKLKDRDESNYSSKIFVSGGQAKIEDFLENEVSGNDMVVRGLPISAINRKNSRTESTPMESLIPPNWFDPENRLSDDYYNQMGKFPTVVPKDGNLYVDGRIIGPTIDEIWIMLKKLTGGRLSDINSKGRETQLDLGIPVGTGVRLNNTNTTMTEVPDSEFNFTITTSDNNKEPKYGDPIDFQYSPEGGSTNPSLFDQRLNITKFINQNNTITYPVYKSLKLLSDKIVAHTDEGEHIIEGVDGNITTNRRITNFTAWKDINSDKEQDNIVKENDSIESGFWGPRSAPYSLRELEAMIMGNKYNIITQARFVKENFAVTGGLGKVAGIKEGDMSNFTSGSLYQLHKNYNFDVANPNTYYNNSGTDTGFKEGNEPVGAKAVIDDDDWRTPEQKSSGHIRYVENYGSSNSLSTDPEQYSSHDVYLSAFGDWRYVSDHNRLPILRGEWI
jgi:hypothetical protein